MRRFLPAVLLLTLLLAAPAAAKPRDRDRDRLPDRWERKHDLKVGKRDGRRDPDRDGLRNTLEYKAGTNPRKADTDGDRLPDGQEVIGKVRSFDGTTLVVRLLRGGTVSGTVDEETIVECPLTARRAQAPDEDFDADNDGLDDILDPADDQGFEDDGGDLEADNAGFDDIDDIVQDSAGDAVDSCGSGALGKGRRVYGAELVDGAFALVELTR